MKKFPPASTERFPQLISAVRGRRVTPPHLQQQHQQQQQRGRESKQEEEEVAERVQLEGRKRRLRRYIELATAASSGGDGDDGGGGRALLAAPLGWWRRCDRGEVPWYAAALAQATGASSIDEKGTASRHARYGHTPSEFGRLTDVPWVRVSDVDYYEVHEEGAADTEEEEEGEGESDTSGGGGGRTCDEDEDEDVGDAEHGGSDARGRGHSPRPVPARVWMAENYACKLALSRAAPTLLEGDAVVRVMRREEAEGEEGEGERHWPRLETAATAEGWRLMSIELARTVLSAAEAESESKEHHAEGRGKPAHSGCSSDDSLLETHVDDVCAGVALPGDGFLTKGYALWPRFVIHVVPPPPPSRDTSTFESRLECLRQCYRNVFKLVGDNKLRTVALRVITPDAGAAGEGRAQQSSGRAASPAVITLALAARVAVEETAEFMRRHHSAVNLVLFCCASRREYRALRREVMRYDWQSLESTGG